MADVPDEEEFRFPSEFLPDDLFMESENLRTAAFKPVCMMLPNEFPNEFDSFGSSSVLSSPVESTVSSSETESSDEDFLAALTQRLAQSSLSETKTPPYFCLNQQEKKNWYVSGSPQSTLAGIGKFVSPRTISGNGSPEGPFQCLSPPETPFGDEKDTWNLVYSATKRFETLNTGYETSKQDTNTISQTSSYPSRCTRTLSCLKSPPETPFGDEKDTWNLVYSATKRFETLNTGYETSKQDTNTISQTSSYPSRCTRTLSCLKSPSSGSYSDPRLFQYLPQSSQLQCRRYEQVSTDECSLECRKMAAFSFLQQQRHRFETRERNIVHENGRCEPPEALVYHHPWQTQNQSKQPQHNRSVLQPPINGRSAVKRKSVGTGVFLPRSYANPPEQRKHTGFPTDHTVKVQEFSLGFKDTNERRRGPFVGELVASYGKADSFAAPKYGISTQQRHGYRADAALKHELFLPFEWTY